jgi:sterol desaturase/sphingolipid hydroxylase (fatty acid hydroxylase superfamily)
MIENNLGILGIALPAGLLVLLVLLEYLSPRRKLVLGRSQRWATHGIFFLCNAALGRALVLIITVGSTAGWTQEHEFGLFYLTSWPYVIEGLLAFVILDFAVWLQHVLMHRSLLLWRMHKVHHSDRDLDATSALRFHPFELLVSVIYKSAWVAFLGVPVIIALAFELWLNCNALFNHSNIEIPRWLNKMLRISLVTPDTHFVHHSIHVDEQNKNFGFALNWWDKLFGFYQTESIDGRDGQVVGLKEAQDRKPDRAVWSLLLPLR